MTKRCVLWRRLQVWEAEKAEHRLRGRSEGSRQTQALRGRGSKWALNLPGLHRGRAEWHGLGLGLIGRRILQLLASLDRGPVSWSRRDQLPRSRPAEDSCGGLPVLCSPEELLGV